MPKIKKGKKEKKSDTMVAYTGPIKPVFSAKQLSTSKKFGSWIQAANSNVAGVINNAFVVSPSTLNDWGNWQNDWSEYRILAWEVEYIPVFTYATPSTSTAGGVIIGIVDRTSSTSALSSTAQALEFEGAKFCSINKPFKLTAKATGPNELAWLNITTSSYWSSARFFSTPLTPSAGYGNFVVSILVEFRSAL